eukprot:CAMPEP_0172306078 /NCGR_PEP_ID=MMETSP1058-20130122/7223_1 /TAXON_ID=83371 /ORGANISM="Detonula confervacea, Strain CCMP 353" /LENGTH=230 /DNA_ID=CAMNT_0013017855 /DNA_START=189 /DNA_END=878 /DNA_ORIENTATION=+
MADTDGTKEDYPSVVADRNEDPAKHVFLTEQKKNCDVRIGDRSDGKDNGEISGDKNWNDALREMEALDKQEDQFPTLEFPVTINIRDAIDPVSSNMSCISSINAHSTHGSVQNSIERNKSLCGVAGGNNLLTVEEEERISELLIQDEEDVEQYGSMPSTEEDREAELDGLLLGLGYSIENNDDQVGNDDESESKKGSRGDPVLRELAKQRIVADHERRIDHALRALLCEP